MPPSLCAKLKEGDSEYRSRTVTIDAHGKTVRTPKRALTLRRDYCESRVIRNRSVRGMNEVVCELNENILNGIDNDKERLLEFIRRLQAGFAHVDRDNEISFFLFFFNSQGKRPTDSQIDYLANLVTGSPYNDIIVPPIIRGISGEDYVEYLRLFMESLETYVSNPRIMGSIPHIAHIELPDICRFYMKNNVTFFALDMDGKNPLDMFPNVNEVYRTMRLIEEKELSGEECCYLHGINIRRPRGLVKKNFAPARDILVFEMGFNSFGSSHLKPKLKADLWQKILASNVAWVFNRGDYGYYPTTSPDIRSIPKEVDPVFSLGEVLSSSQRNKDAKMFNVERQGLEASTIQKCIAENELPKYLDGKLRASESLKQIRKKLSIGTRLSDVL